MRFHSLESRIVTLFLLLMLVVQVANFFAIRRGITENARTSIREQLVIGERVFQRLLEQNTQKLTQGARLLAADYGLKQAVSTNDRETIASVLANHGARINASLTLLIGIDREIKASTAKNLPGNLRQLVLSLVDKARHNGDAGANTVIDNIPYQVVAVPVNAPTTIGWIVMTFPIDQRLVSDMQALSSLQVSVLTRENTGQWVANASTLSVQDAAGLTRQLQNIPDDTAFLPELQTEDREFSASIVALTRAPAQRSVVVLQRSFSEAIAPYQRLQFGLLILTALSIVVTVAGSIFTAKRIAGPLRQLAETAKRLGAGDYRGEIQIRRNDEIGQLAKAFGSMRDDIAYRELEIRRLAYWDTLTNLPNRAQFVQLLSEAITQARANNSHCHILMLDLDRFKNVNDVLGHSFGDALLHQVAERLKHQLAGTDAHLARLGGDEFAILLSNAGIDQAQAVAARILQSLETPISLDEQTVDLGAGIGIAGFPAHGTDAESLLIHVEVAMYAAKRSGNVAVIYDPVLDQSSQQNLSLLSELRRAIEQNEFRLYVQPKLMLSTGKIVGLEALVRWQHPERGIILPDNFIPFAEKTGFIRSLTRWMLEQSAALCNHLHRQNTYLKISVNLSARDLLDQDLPLKFGEILARHNVTPASFCLEITESAIMDDPVRALQTLERLHAMGVDLSIDDFGTGYSSLAYLKRLPVDELKIDKSFVLNMERDIEDAKIVRSTIDLGHNMELRVVAEGVENIDVWHLLVKMGCDQGQGYFMSRPIPADQLIDWIATWAAPSGPATVNT